AALARQFPIECKRTAIAQARSNAHPAGVVLIEQGCARRPGSDAAVARSRAVRAGARLSSSRFRATRLQPTSLNRPSPDAYAHNGAVEWLVGHYLGRLLAHNP